MLSFIQFHYFYLHRFVFQREVGECEIKLSESILTQENLALAFDLKLIKENVCTKLPVKIIVISDS